ncbi:MAG TPA: hypothetical protein PKO06_15365 [Candidatus Ozemobacteraceae bacterium]|nr:hypothetical protein [Candidatus Ozemobacteraceae bacterium]
MEQNFRQQLTDRCVEHGEGAGFQFEVRCDRCHEVWQSEFVPFRQAQTAGWLHRLTWLFGGGSNVRSMLQDVAGSSTGSGSGLLRLVLGWLRQAGILAHVVDGVAESGFRPARDQALSEAAAKAEKHYHHCPACRHWVCDTCWHPELAHCADCAGNRRLMETVGAAKVCPACRKTLPGAPKFCPDCGHPIEP